LKQPRLVEQWIENDLGLQIVSILKVYD